MYTYKTHLFKVCHKYRKPITSRVQKPHVQALILTVALSYDTQRDKLNVTHSLRCDPRQLIRTSRLYLLHSGCFSAKVTHRVYI